jgi:formylglycine-generating enzyme required for sulfatase activity
MKTKSIKTLLLSGLVGLGTYAVQAQLVTLDFVNVGDAGNAAQSSSNREHTQSGGDGYGAVGYDYGIGKYEVTISQYTTFLNAVADTDTHSLYSASMGSNDNIAGITRSGSSGSYSYTEVSGSGNRPISYVNWFDAARFSNWLHNGATDEGDTEFGAYTLNGATSGVISANEGALFRLPSEDEWYKAAYYDPTLNSGVGGYTLHANGSDTMTSNSPATAGSANYNDGDYSTTQSGYIGSQNYLTDVGAFSNTENYYGTFDQGGNLWEWNDDIVSTNRGFRGGAWNNGEVNLRSSVRFNFTPEVEGADIGFRVASIPEPSALMLALIFLGASLLIFRRRLSL